MARDLLDYEVRFETKSSLVPHDDPEQFVLGIEGSILCNGRRAGSIRANVVQIGRAQEEGEDPFEIFDTNGSLFEAYEAVVDHRSGWIKDRFASGAGADVIHIDRVEVHPRHRGQNVGLLAVLRTIEVYGGGCGLATGKPFPLQHQHSRERTTPVPEEVFRRDLRRLSSHWRKLGFVPVRGSKIYVLDLEAPPVRFR